MATIRPSELLFPVFYPNDDPKSGAGQTQSDYDADSLRTLAELLKIDTFTKLHPEMQRRHVAMWVASFVETGRRMGVGTAWRSYATQLAAWKRNPKQFTNPDYSYHCDRLPHGLGMAVDNVPGDTFGWLATAAKRFQLKVLTDNEKHHTQPIEVPTSASAYSRNPAGYWALVKINVNVPYLGTLSLAEWLSRNEPITVTGPTPVPPPADTDCKVSTELVKGMSGNEVKCLQTALRAAGATITVDGQFGTKTEDAVKAFQQAKGLTVDGRAGQKTLTALGIWGGATPAPPPTQRAPNGLTAGENVTAGRAASTPPPIPTINRDLVHNNSPWLQQVLCGETQSNGQPYYPPLWVGEGRVGDEPAVFQKFGDGGADALAAWQKNNGLTPDGVYGPKTAEKMRAVRGR